MRGDGSSNEDRLRTGRRYRTDRTEAISDGVFAVSLTLLILDVRPPEGGVSQLVHGLVLIAPRLGTFALSFAVVAYYATVPGWGGKEITMPTRADDELEIMRLLARLAQAVDHSEAYAYPDCLADEVVSLVSDASPNEVWRAVPREGYARRAGESVAAVDWTHHRLCNFVIVVAGGPGHGKVDVVAQMQAPRTDNGGAPPLLTGGGRYDLEFG